MEDKDTSLGKNAILMMSSEHLKLRAVEEKGNYM